VRPLDEALEQARALAHERSVQVQADPPGEALPLLGDPQRLRQLLTVLLDNAVRYSHAGGSVRARVRRVADAKGTAQAELQVADDGIGIPADELPHVFDRNFRGERARRHRADGSGLGLAIGAALARAHGGEIRIDSRSGAGTTVTLCLPLLSQGAAAPAS
jgi:signal transduction histidine kinase